MEIRKASGVNNNFFTQTIRVARSRKIKTAKFGHKQFEKGQIKAK
jgi:hypothetical protein